MSKADYYAEEKTLVAPGSTNAAAVAKKTTGAAITPQPQMGGGDKLYGRELRDVDDKDIESLLANLSVEELEDLNNDFDPDNSLLPPSQRCRNQTTKAPTGPFKRDNLLKHLEETAKNEKDWEEVVPFSPGIKRGKVFEPKGGFPDNNGGQFGGKLGMQMPIELDLDDEDDEEDDEDEDEEFDVDDADIDTKIEQALDRAPEKDLVDLAGILGMHNVLNQPQYYNALKGRGQDENTGGISFNGVIKAYQPRIVPDEPENETDVDDCIKRLEADDSTLEEVNINNMKRVSKERIRYLIKAATQSTHIRKLCLANTAISDAEARPLIDLIEQSTSLKALNIESNFISPELIAKLIRATLVKQVMVEFHAENQRASVLGNQIEMDIMMSVEESDSLLRVGVSLHSMEARHRVSEALERNYERLRLKRLESRGK